MNERWDVLVIDDEPVVCGAVRLVLEHEIGRVAVAPDGAAALAHPALESCRLVVCDIMLPGRSGLDVVTDIHAIRPDVPILLMTGYATPEIAARAHAAGATAFLPKPFDDTELLDQVRLVLGRGGVAKRETGS